MQRLAPTDAQREDVDLVRRLHPLDAQRFIAFTHAKEGCFASLFHHAGQIWQCHTADIYLALIISPQFKQAHSQAILATVRSALDVAAPLQRR
jgi:hypothetical protein